MWQDIWTVLSNLALLIPMVTAIRYRRVLRAFILPVECFFSAVYHLCDSFDLCFFSFTTHANFDFFFAQTLIVLAAFYFIDFKFGWEWLEWVLILLSFVGIAVLQAALPGEFMVQVAITVFAFIIVVAYWIFFHVPDYNWTNVATGVSFMAISVVFFNVQNSVDPSLYWAIHSLWHLTASVGLDYIFRIKPKAYVWQSAASKVRGKPGMFLGLPIPSA